MNYAPARLRTGFTLIELLAVIALMVLLASAMSSTIRIALDRGQRAACANNLRQLFLANEMYALENGSYVPACSDIYGKNLERWHGTRRNTREPFKGASGPLSPYLGNGRVRECPRQGKFKTSAAANAFESACGGYGYNAVGVGSRTFLLGMHPSANAEGMAPGMIGNPAKTIMFCDTAFPQPYGNKPKYLIEYSFAEPYFWVISPGESSNYRADPSIHFRHRGKANVVWCDGHISAERLETSAQQHFSDMQIGWFGPPDNSFFVSE